MKKEKINWVVWDSVAYGLTGWESSIYDTEGDLGFETLAEAWEYYKERKDRKPYSKNCVGEVFYQWCTKPKSVVVRRIDTTFTIEHEEKI